MKAPRKPTCPKSPEKPSETLKLPHSVEIPFSKEQYTYCGNYAAISLSELLELVPKGISLNDIELVEEYDDYIDIFLRYYSDEPNPHYDKQMVDYKKQLIRYQKRVAEYKARMVEYLPKEAEYREWLVKDIAERKEKNHQKEVKRLKSMLKKLEKK
jgi:hypothetical protein